MSQKSKNKPEPRNILKRKREIMGLSQQEVADKLNFSRSTYAAIERGETDPSLEKGVKLSKFFSVDIQRLLV